MGFFRALWRMAAVGTMLGIALPLQAFIMGPVFHDRTTIPNLMSRALRPVLGIRVTFNGAALEKEHHPLVYICNHLSYLDPLILGRHFPASYVCQDGAKDMPIVGRFCKEIGTIFVRRTAAFLVQMQGDMAKALNEKRDVAIFPEGHISDGKDVLPFFNGALSVLFNNKSGVPLEENTLVQPLALRLVRVGGQDVETHPELRDIFTWSASDVGMWAHLWRLMHVRKVEVELTALPVMNPADFRAGREGRIAVREFTAAAYDLIRSAVVQPVAAPPQPAMPGA